MRGLCLSLILTLVIIGCGVTPYQELPSTVPRHLGVIKLVETGSHRFSPMSMRDIGKRAQPGSVVTITPGLFKFSHVAEDKDYNVEPAILKNPLTIRGAGMDQTWFRVRSVDGLFIDTKGTVILEDMTLERAPDARDDGGTLLSHAGGRLILRRCRLVTNGEAINLSSDASLLLEDSEIVGGKVVLWGSSLPNMLTIKRSRVYRAEIRVWFPPPDRKNAPMEPLLPVGAPLVVLEGNLFFEPPSGRALSVKIRRWVNTEVVGDYGPVPARAAAGFDVHENLMVDVEPGGPMDHMTGNALVTDDLAGFGEAAQLGGRSIRRDTRGNLSIRRVDLEAMLAQSGLTLAELQATSALYWAEDLLLEPAERRVVEDPWTALAARLPGLAAEHPDQAIAALHRHLALQPDHAEALTARDTLRPEVLEWLKKRRAEETAAGHPHSAALRGLQLGWVRGEALDAIIARERFSDIAATAALKLEEQGDGLREIELDALLAKALKGELDGALALGRLISGAAQVVIQTSQTAWQIHRSSEPTTHTHWYYGHVEPKPLAPADKARLRELYEALPKRRAELADLSLLVESDYSDVDAIAAFLSGERTAPNQALEVMWTAAASHGALVGESHLASGTAGYWFLLDNYAKLLKQRRHLEALEGTLAEPGLEQRNIEVPASREHLKARWGVAVDAHLGTRVLISTMTFERQIKDATTDVWVANPAIGLEEYNGGLVSDDELRQIWEREVSPEVVKALAPSILSAFHQPSRCGELGSDALEAQSQALLVRYPPSVLRDAWLTSGDKGLYALCR